MITVLIYNIFSLLSWTVAENTYLADISLPAKFMRPCVVQCLDYIASNRRWLVLMWYFVYINNYSALYPVLKLWAFQSNKFSIDMSYCKLVHTERELWILAYQNSSRWNSVNTALRVGISFIPLFSCVWAFHWGTPRRVLIVFVAWKWTNTKHVGANRCGSGRYRAVGGSGDARRW